MLEDVSWSPKSWSQHVFSAEKKEKVMPSVTGQVDLHFVGRISPENRMKIEKKYFYKRGCKGNR